jgi:hypothetical protein
VSRALHRQLLATPLAVSCRVSEDLAAQLHADVEKVQQAIVSAHPPLSTRFGKQLWAHWTRSVNAANSVCERQKVISDLAPLAHATGFAPWPPEGRRRRPSAAPAQTSPEQQQQTAEQAATAAAAADDMAQLLMVRSGVV